MSLYTVLLTGFYLLLREYAQQDDLVIGTPTANRHYPGTENMIGFFVNSLVLRIKLDGEQSIENTIRQVYEMLNQAQGHQDIPFEKLVDYLQVAQDPSRHPLFQVMFGVQNYEHPLSPFKFLPLKSQHQVAKFDITLFIDDNAECLQGWFNYATSLFAAQTIERMIEHYVNILTLIITHTKQPIKTLSCLGQADKEKIVDDWNQTERSYPLDRTIAQLFEEQAERTPCAIALVFEGESLTYRELNNRANQLARFIRKKYQEQVFTELKPDTLIALCVHRSVEMIVGILGIFKAGGAYVPIDPNFPYDRINYILDDTKTALVLTERVLLKNFQNRINPLQIITLDEQNRSAELADNLPPQSGYHNLAYVIYTSGTTGKPKGVMIEQHSIVNALYLIRNMYRIDSITKKVAAYTNFVFDMSVAEFLAPLLQGGELHLLSEQTRSDIGKLSDYLQVQHIHHIFLPPAVLAILPKIHYPHLKHIMIGGESCNQTMEFWAKYYSLFNYYGPTEGTIYATGTVAHTRNMNIIGPLLNNIKGYVLNKNLQPVPIGVAGELYIAGAGLARGYLNQPELTLERFIVNPFATEEDKAKGYTRLYKTGDLVRWLSDGNLEYLGRNDFQIKLRGYRIELGEIENVLSNHPEIKQNVVLVRTQDGQQYLTAYYVATSTLSQTELVHFLSQYLPDYMIPSCYMHLESLPLTRNGKLDRDALPDPKFIEELIYVSPRNELERQLCEIWKELLKVEKISIYDDFFRRGGNSILAIQATHRIKQEINREISIIELFQHKTVARLSEVLSVTETQSFQHNKKNNNPIDKFIDLDQELFDKTMVLNTEKKGDFVLPKNILLTGSTGYIGAFLLHDLLAETTSTIYCLIRASNISEATIKLYNNLNKYQIKIKDKYRVIPVLGDLEKNNLGLEIKDYTELSSLIDVIYHNGAYVHHLLPYETLKQSNVRGTFEIIKFAKLNKIKFIHFISTIGVLPKSINQIFDEETPIEKILHVESQGYAASKWVAENMIMRASAAGIPTHIYRIGRAAASSKTGVCNLDDFFYRLIRSCIKIGYYPDIPFNFDATPVDLISKQIIEIAKADQSPNEVFHIISPQATSLASIFKYYNLHEENIKFTSLPLWCQMVRDSIIRNQPLPISPYLFQFDRYADTEFSSPIKFDELDHISNYKTMCYLKNINENYCLDVEQYYRKNFAYIEATGVF